MPVGGRQEVQAAKQRLTAAMEKASSAAKMLESAKEAEEWARKTREDAESQLRRSEREVEAARRFLTESEGSLELFEDKDIMGSLSDTALLEIASYLDAKSHLNMAMTRKRFGGRSADFKKWSLMEEASRIRYEGATDEEKHCLPRIQDQSWIGLYRELELLTHLPFNTVIGTGVLHGEGSSRVAFERDIGHNSCHICCAISDRQRMISGKHFASFNIEVERAGGGEFVGVGVMRPIENQWRSRIARDKSFTPADTLMNYELLDMYNDLHEEKGWGAEGSIQCCMYNLLNGCRVVHDWIGYQCGEQSAWGGMESGNRKMDEGKSSLTGLVGLLLDLDEGTLTVYLDNRRLGVIQKGLSGEYCWFVNFFGERGSVRGFKHGMLR